MTSFLPLSSNLSAPTIGAVGRVAKVQQGSLLIIALASLLSLLCANGAEDGVGQPQNYSSNSPTLTINLGVVANATVEPRLSEIRTHYNALEEYWKAQGTNVHFRIAYGGYNDLLYWAKNDMIDLGHFSPAVWNILNRMKLDWREIAVETLHEKAGRYVYQSIGIVPEDCLYRNWNDVVSLLEKGNEQLVATDPFSLSGYFAPCYYLSQSNINPGSLKRSFRFTHDDPASVLHEYKINGTGPQLIPVVFLRTPKSNISGFTPIVNCPLNDLWLPHAGIAVNPRFYETNEALLNRIFAAPPPGGAQWFAWHTKRSEATETPIADEKEIHRWIQDVQSKFGDSTPDLPDVELLTLDDIGYQLRSYADQSLNASNSVQLKKMKIALVLSGGGAKCSFQVGAVRALELKLLELRNRAELDLDPRRKEQANLFNISLVVGTSGGAINAIPVALGETEPIKGYDMEDIEKTGMGAMWMDLHKWRIFRLHPWVCLALALCFGLGCGSAALVTGLVVRVKSRAQIWWFGMVLATLILMCFCIALGKYFDKWGSGVFFETNFWLYSACFALATGVIYSLHAWFRRQNAPGAPFITVGGTVTLAAVVLACVCVTAALVFKGTSSLIAPDGLDQELVNAYSKMKRLNLRPNVTLGQAKTNLGQSIVGKLDRDLVITASNIQPVPGLPSDFYFYARSAKRHGDPWPKRGSNWRELSTGDSLLDLVLGSGAIFPMFPSRSFYAEDLVPEIDRKHARNQIELVDGGFAHNSPLEAATELDATHIFLIEASPRNPDKVGKVAHNLRLAYEHLHGEAQSADSRALHTTTATIFALRPPTLEATLTQFDRIHVLAAMKQGENLALLQRQGNANGWPGWQRLPACPRFHD